MSNHLKTGFMGFVVGIHVLVFWVFVYSQYRFSVNQEVFTIGFVDGAWSDPIVSKKGK